MLIRRIVKLKSDVVRAVLAEAGISQNAFAKLIPVTSGYMSELMHGTKHPSPFIQRRIQYVLGGCRFEDLFEVEERQGRYLKKFAVKGV